MPDGIAKYSDPFDWPSVSSADLPRARPGSSPALSMTGPFDYLFIDEAGQVSLADALAMGTAAKNLVLVGDPQQLDQVIQGTHPDGSEASVLRRGSPSHSV
jgi:superfamily I DNA and/or RNA helicase